MDTVISRNSWRQRAVKRLAPGAFVVGALAAVTWFVVAGIADYPCYWSPPGWESNPWVEWSAGLSWWAAVTLVPLATAIGVYRKLRTPVWIRVLSAVITALVVGYVLTASFQVFWTVKMNIQCFY